MKIPNLTRILGIIFWTFATFQKRFDTPQVKRYLISSIKSMVHELPNDVRLRILENQIILEKCQNWVETQPGDSLRSRSQVLAIAIKNHANSDTKVLSSCLPCSKLFVQYCLCEQIFAYNSSQSRANFNILMLFTTLKPLSKF